MTKLSNKIIDEINKKNVKPIPKYQFLLKKYIIWILFILSILIGSLSFAFILFQITDIDFEIYNELNEIYPNYIFQIIPFIWILIMGLFLFVAYYNFKYTDSGYKYNNYIILFISFLLSIILGFIMYFFNVSAIIETNIIEIYVPSEYQKMLNPQKNIWNNPNKGLLHGILKKRENRNRFIIEDINNKIWYIDTNNIPINIQNDFQINQRIKIQGIYIDEKEFKAKKIIPWGKINLRKNETK